MQVVVIQGVSHKPYTLAPRAPPALSPEDFRSLGRPDPADQTRQETQSEASFSGRDDPNNGALQRRDFGKFVQFFRMAGSYIAGHRGKLFIICIPGEVSPFVSTKPWLLCSLVAM